MTHQLALGRYAAVLFVTSVLCYGSTAGGSLTSTDALATFELSRNLVEAGSVALTTNPSGSERNRGVDGRYYAKQGIAHAVYSIPFYLVGRLAERVVGTRLNQPDMIPKAAVALGSIVAAAGCVALTFLFAWRLTQSWLASLFGALALGFGTLLWPYSKFGFNAPLAAFCLVSATYAAWVGTRLDRPRMLVLAGGLLGTGWLVRHEFVLAVIPITVWCALEAGADRRKLGRWLGLLAPGVLAGGGVWATYNWIRFGSLLDVGYSPTYGADGIYGLLLSPGGSLFLYSPVLLAGVAALTRLWRSDRHLIALLGGQIAVLFCFYASLDDWVGGRSYGPRYLVPTIPLFCVALGWWFHRCGARGRALLVGLTLVSVLVQVPGILVDYSKPNAHDRAAAPVTHTDRQYSWRGSYLVSNLRTTWRAVPQNMRYVLGGDSPPLVTQASAEQGQSISEQLAFSLDVWWLYLFYLGVLTASVAVGLGLAPLGVALLLSRRLRLGVQV